MILLYLAQRRDSQKQGFCGDHTRLGSRTLMDVRKLREGDMGREGSTEDVWDISSFNSPSRTAAKQMSITHLRLVSPITGNCTVVLIIYCCHFLLFFLMFVVLCVCQLVYCSTTAGLAEAPERVKQQRDQTITKTLI